ncbi:hypothetical protein ACHQM5_017987 [Ranunculus cassubicifolius]
MDSTEKINLGSRINELPDEILHHVLSFLDMKEVVDTALVSTRWRYLWIHVKTLNFSFSFWKGRGGFNDFVEEVFLLRDGSSANKFSLVGLNLDNLNKWLIMVSRKHIPQVALTIFSPEKAKELTPLLFTSRVEVLDIISPWINAAGWPKYSIHLPNAICCAPHLKTLNLNSVRLPNGDSKREVTLKCLVLENLILEDCYYSHLISFNISIPQLKILTVKNIDTELVKSVGSCKIKISTPNLTILWLKCCSFDNYVIENCDSLVSAKVEFASGTLLGDDRKASLRCFKNVTRLELSNWTREICLEFQDMLDQMPDIFCNLRSLKLVKWHQPCFIHVSASLLSRSINIEYLVLELIQGNSNPTIDSEDIMKLVSFQCMFDHLKSVEILYFTECQVEMKLLESLLKNAKSLEELTVVVNSSTNTRVRLKECARKIYAFPKASSRLLTFVLPP